MSGSAHGRRYTDPTQTNGRPRPSPLQQVERVCEEQLDRVLLTLMGAEQRIRDRKLSVYDEEELSPAKREWVRVR